MRDNFLTRIHSHFLFAQEHGEENGRHSRRDWVLLLTLFMCCVAVAVILGIILLSRAERAANILPGETKKTDLYTIDRNRLREDVEALARLRASFEAALGETPSVQK